MNTKDKSDIITLNSIKIEKALKIISIYINNDVYKFSDIFEDAYARQGAEIQNFFNELKAAYISYYVLADDSLAEQMDSNLRNFTYEFFVNKFKMDQLRLTHTEALGRKHLMEFLGSLILNFKSKNISSHSLMGLSKAYYLIDNYKKINYEGYLRLESSERDEEGDLRGYVFRIYCDEAILCYEGYTHGNYGGDSEYEEMFNFDNDYDEFGEPELKISCWIDEFENIFNNTGTFSVDDSTVDIEQIKPDDDTDENEDKDYEREEE